jgi:hypothetical protein
MGPLVWYWLSMFLVCYVLFAFYNRFCQRFKLMLTIDSVRFQYCNKIPAVQTNFYCFLSVHMPKRGAIQNCYLSQNYKYNYSIFGDVVICYVDLITRQWCEKRNCYICALLILPDLARFVVSLT